METDIHFEFEKVLSVWSKLKILLLRNRVSDFPSRAPNSTKCLCCSQAGWLSSNVLRKDVQDTCEHYKSLGQNWKRKMNHEKESDKLWSGSMSHVLGTQTAIPSWSQQTNYYPADKDKLSHDFCACWCLVSKSGLYQQKLSFQELFFSPHNITVLFVITQFKYSQVKGFHFACPLNSLCLMFAIGISVVFGAAHVSFEPLAFWTCIISTSLYLILLAQLST